MKVKVKFLQGAGDDKAGDVKTIDATRAERLARTGYVRILEGGETATVEATDDARRPKGERRG
jgi:hypothetical protein